jgi:hypothetical protein
MTQMAQIVPNMCHKGEPCKGSASTSSGSCDIGVHWKSETSVQASNINCNILAFWEPKCAAALGAVESVFRGSVGRRLDGACMRSVCLVPVEPLATMLRTVCGFEFASAVARRGASRKTLPATLAEGGEGH